MQLACVFMFSGVFSSWAAYTESSPDTKADCSQSAEQRGFHQQKLLLESRQNSLSSPESRYPVHPLYIKKKKNKTKHQLGKPAKT